MVRLPESYSTRVFLVISMGQYPRTGLQRGTAIQYTCSILHGSLTTSVADSRSVQMVPHLGRERRSGFVRVGSVGIADVTRRALL